MINPLTIGVDIGGTRTKYGLVDLRRGEILHTIVTSTEKKDEKKFLQQVEVAINECKSVSLAKDCEITGIGLGVPGFINEGGIVETTYGFLEFMENYPLQAIIDERFSLACRLDNDARTVALGEALYGKGKDYKRVLTLTLGTGVGFGFVVNGSFVEALPLAHMGGHMRITDEGDTCYCGKQGCLEALASSTGIISLAKKNNFDGALAVEAIFEAAVKGDANAIIVVDSVISYLHTALHNYVNLFAPGIIVLGGGIAKGLVPYLDRIKGLNYLSPYPAYSFQLAVSELEELAGILGSAALFHSNTLQTTAYENKK